jgi:hypothetical protein
MNRYQTAIAAHKANSCLWRTISMAGPIARHIQHEEPA